jgi:hypothetical protein
VKFRSAPEAPLRNPRTLALALAVVGVGYGLDTLAFHSDQLERLMGSGVALLLATALYVIGVAGREPEEDLCGCGAPLPEDSDRCPSCAFPLNDSKQPRATEEVEQ